MRNALSLFRVLYKNTEMPRPKAGSRGRLYNSLGVIAICCIMLPCCAVVGYISYVMGYALINVDSPMAGLQTEIHILSAFSMVFGFLVIFNVMFFSSDREHLMPLPFKSEEILLAKFAHSYLAESVMEFLILLSMFIGFFIAFLPVYGACVISVISGLIAVFLIPLAPLCYCSIISLILMAFLKNIKSRKIISQVYSIVFFLFVALFLFSFKDMGNITVENYIDSLANNSNLFNNVLNGFFFTVPLLLLAIEQNSILYLLLYILANAAVVAVMLFLGKYLYQSGLYTVASLGSGKKRALDTIHVKKISPFVSYLKKEFRVLMRTRAYYHNCIFINLLWPVAALLLLIFQHEKEIMQQLIYFFSNGYPNAYILFDISVIAVSFIATSMNSLASTAFTREGAHLSLIKYIPVSYKTQMNAKGLVSVIVSYPALLLTMLIAGIGLHIPPLWYLYYAVLILAAVVISTLLGLYLDSSHPHTSWDDEYSALRGNLNAFFDMALIMVITVIICGIGFILSYVTKMTTGTHIFYGVVMVLGTIICLLIFPKKIIRNMKELY